MKSLVERVIHEVEQRQIQYDIRAGSNPNQSRNRRFCELTREKTVTEEGILEFIEKESERAESSFSLPITAKLVSLAARSARRGRVQTTNQEPIDIVIYIHAAFEKILDNGVQIPDGATVVVSTLATYRPHARVEKISDQLFSIQLGRYLFWDAFNLSCTVYDLLGKARDQNEKPFSEVFRKSVFEKYLASTHHSEQFRYVLSSIALGEKLRCLAVFDQDIIDTKISYVTHFTLLIHIFWLGHELSHVQKHFGAGSQNKKDGIFEIISYHLFSSFKDSDVPEPLKQFYVREYLAGHCQEFEADLDGYVLCANVAIDLFSNKLVGIAAATLSISLIALLDRLNYLVVKRVDVLSLVGLKNYNQVPFAAEYCVPRKSHPWGKTRIMALTTLLHFGHSLASRAAEDELNAHKNISNCSYALIGQADVEAFEAVAKALMFQGELTVHVRPDEVIVTEHFKDREPRFYTVPWGKFGSTPLCDITDTVNSATSHL